MDRTLTPWVSISIHNPWCACAWGCLVVSEAVSAAWRSEALQPAQWAHAVHAVVGPQTEANALLQLGCA